MGPFNAPQFSFGFVTMTLLDSVGHTVMVTPPDPDGAGPGVSPVSKYEYVFRGTSVHEIDTTVIDVVGRTTKTTTNAQGQTLLSVDANGTTVAKIGYDTSARVVRQGDANGNFSTTFYGDTSTGLATMSIDAVQNAVSIIDPNNNETITTFDGLNRKVNETQQGTGAGRTWVIDGYKTTFTDSHS